MKASVAPMRKRIENKIILFVEYEKVKHEIQFNNKITEQTLLGPNLVKIKLTKRLAQDNPKYTNEPIKACSE